MKGRIIGALASVPFLAAALLSGDSGAAGCPYGMVNCSYPGQCGRYIDADGDGLCDLSQTTTTADSDPSSSDAASSTGQAGSDPSNSNQSIENVNTTVDPGNNGNSGFFGDGHGYFILPISLILIIGYLFTYFLFKKGILKRSKHRRIWNILVTIGYLGTSGTGILLILFISLGIKTALNPSITFWHAELAILMVIGTFIHIHIYWKSFRNMFRVLFGFKASVPKKNRNTEIFVNLNKK
jgi:hypothetical protein